MAGEIATAFVRIRPNMAGFRGETESGVRSAFSNISKIVGGAFAAVGTFQLGKNLIEAASQHQAAFAVLDTAIKNAGASTKGFGASLDEVLEKEARLKGFTDEQLATGLTTLVSVTHNTRKAFTDLQEAEDLARARHVDLTTASLALARAEQGSTQTLSRFGVKVPEVTAHVDRLKKAHDEAVASGAKFTGQTELEYKALLAQAKAADTAATRQEALRLVQERFGGVASTFARTSAGEFARFTQNVHQLEVTIGRGLLPVITSITSGASSYIGALATSERFQSAVASGARDLGQALGVVRSVAETVGPPLLTVAKAGADVARVIGAAPILTAIVTYKGLVTVIEKAAAVEKSYAEAVALGRAGQIAAAAATDSQLGVFGRLNASLQATRVARLGDADAGRAQAAAVVESTGAVASFGATVDRTTPLIAAKTAALIAEAAAAQEDAVAGARLVDIYAPLGGALGDVVVGARAATEGFRGLGAAQSGAGAEIGKIGPAAGEASTGLTALAGSEVAAGVAGETSAVGGIAALARGIGRFALGAVGGPVGAALIGLAAIGGGIAYLVTRESAAEKETKRLGDAIKNFGDAAKSEKSAVQALADARIGLESDRAAVITARLTLETARHTLATSNAAKGSITYREQVAAVATALAGYHSALRQVADDQRRISDSQAQVRSATQATAVAFANVTGHANSLRAALQAQYVVYGAVSRGGVEVRNATATLANEQKHADDVVQHFTNRIRSLIPELQRTQPLIAHNTELLAEYTEQVGRIPSAKVTKIILSTPNLDATLKTVDEKLKSLDPVAYADGQAIGVLWGQGILAGIKGVENPFGKAFTAFQAQVETVPKKTQEAIRKALASGIFSEEQIAKQFGVTKGQVSAIEKQAEALAEARKKAQTTALSKPISIPDIEAIVPFKIKIEEAGAATDAARRKVLIDKIDFFNTELQKHLTEATRKNILLERASLQAELDQLNAAARAAGLTTGQSIAAANREIENSVVSAKKNLDHIGNLLADSVAKFLQKTGQSIGGVGGPGGPVGDAYQKLLALLKSGAPTVELSRAAALLESQTATQGKTAGSLKDQVRQQFADLTSEFDRGKITAKEANKKLAEILKADHISFRQAGKVLGTAFATGFRGEIVAFHEQVGAIAAVPARFRATGTATADIKIVRPLEVIQRQANQAAIRAEHQRERNIRASERAAKASEKAAATAAAQLALDKARGKTGKHGNPHAKKNATAAVNGLGRP